jgi:PTH1 family peptidyl-tRNA hydrolase
MEQSTILIVGLGNPGAEYAHTPHNLGFMAVDRLAEIGGLSVRRPECNALVGLGKIDGRPVVLAKPQLYMNRSGGPVKALLEKYGLGPADLVAIYDELDLPWQSLRVRMRGSAAGHNGVKSIIAALGTNEFTRVRLGIHPGRPVDAAEFDLTPFRRSQQKEVEELVGHAADAVRSILAEGAAKAMTRFNRRAGGQNTEEK